MIGESEMCLLEPTMIFMMVQCGNISNTESSLNNKPSTYGFLLNVDWYEPFKHSVYAIGLVLLNLPRHLRYDPQNIILCGIILGPPEQYLL